MLKTMLKRAAERGANAAVIIKQVPPAVTFTPDNALEAYLIGVSGDTPRYPRWIGYVVKVEGERQTIAGGEVERVDWSWEPIEDGVSGGGGVGSRAEAIELLLANTAAR